MVGDDLPTIPHFLLFPSVVPLVKYCDATTQEQLSEKESVGRGGGEEGGGRRGLGRSSHAFSYFLNDDDQSGGACEWEGA